MKKKILCSILLSIFLINLSCLVFGVTTLHLDHNNYFQQYPLSGANLQFTITGLPTNDPNINYYIGDRNLVSIIPISSTVIDEQTALMVSEVVIDSPFEIYTTYAIQDLFPNAVQNVDPIEWAYVRTCSDWNHPNEYWMFQDRPVIDYPFIAEVKNWNFGSLARNGFQGNIKIDQNIIDFMPPTVTFNDLEISVETSAFSSQLIKSVISESSINEIGKYNDFYTGDQNVEMSLTSTELSKNYETETDSAKSSLSVSDSVATNDLVKGRLTALGCGIELHDKGEPIPNPIIYPDTPWTALQKNLAPAIGSDITQNDNKTLIMLYPNIALMKRNLYVTTTYPISIDVDTAGGLVFSQPRIVNTPASRTYVYTNTVAAHVNNTNVHFHLQSTFYLYSTVSIKNAQGDYIDLQDPNFKIGDRYWDITIGGDIGGNVTYQEGGINFWNMFGGLFSWLIGIGVAILVIYLAITIGPKLLGSGVRSAKRGIDKSEAKKKAKYEDDKQKEQNDREKAQREREKENKVKKKTTSKKTTKKT